MDVQPESRPSTLAGTEPLFPIRRRGRVPAHHHGCVAGNERRHDGDVGQLRFRRPAEVRRPRTYVGDGRPDVERRAVSVRVREVRSLTAVQPRRLRAGRLHGTAPAVYAGVRLSVDYGGRVRQRADGSGIAMGGQGPFLLPDAGPGRTTTGER